jgi:hypothetical protein
MSAGYDPAQRAAAAAIQNAHPDWVIMYGAHSRMLFAFPLFRAPPGAIIAAPSPPGLLAAMHAAEIAARHHPAPPAATRLPTRHRPAPPHDQRRAP